MTYKEMPFEWIGWVDENIELGVPPNSLIETLIQHNFEPSLCVTTVADRIRKTRPEINYTEAQPKSEFIYEGVRFNSHSSIKTFDKEISILLSMEQPQIVLFGGLLSVDECNKLIEISKDKVTQSTVVDDQTGLPTTHEHRTSSGTFFNRAENAFIEKLEQRIAELTQSPFENGEGLQILHYGIGAEYRPHFDYFPPEIPGSASNMKNGGQRVSTLVMYLNTVPVGGETVFPEVNLKVAPVQGNAVFFSYSNSLNQIDPLTLHGGCSVIEGEKWIATKWIRQSRFVC